MLVTTLCGSLHPASANDAALMATERALAALGVATLRIDGLETLPPFRVDIDMPPSVTNWAAQLGSGDAVVIASPEYAAGPPGVLKNALDWLVGASTLDRKPVAVICAGSTGGPFTIEALVRTLSYQGALTVATLGIAGVQPKRSASGDLVDLGTVSEIDALVDLLLLAVGADEPTLLALVTPVVERHGIGVHRFGLASDVG